MNYTLDDIYGSGIMGPMATNDSPTTNPYEDYLAGNLGGPSLPPSALPPSNTTSTDVPVDAPTALPGPTASFVPPKTVSQSEGTSTSESQSGINFDTLGRLEKGSSIIDKRVAKEMAPIDAELAGQQAEQTRIAGNQGQVIKGVGEIDQKKAEINAQHQVDQEKLVNDYNTDLKTIQEEGQKKVQAAMDTHQKMMQEYTTLQVDPGMMWKNMTGGEKLGSGLSVFASAFLGAKGIDTPVMAMLDKAIDRNIDAQLQNINQKGRALDQQGKLVQMVREQSSSDYEAKLRLKDMAIESGKYHLATQFSQFDSKLAALKSQEMLNNLDQSQLKNRQELFKVRNDAESQITNQQISIRGQELQAAQAAAARAQADRWRREDKEAEAKKALPAEIQDVNERAIVDPTDPTNFLLVPPGTSETALKEYKKKVQSTTKMMKLLNELDEVNNSLGSQYNGPLKTVDYSDRKRQRDQLYQVITNEMAVDWQGTTYSDTWANTMKNVLPRQSWTDDAEVRGTIGQLRQILGDSAQVMKSDFIEPNEHQRNLYIPRVGASLDALGKNRTEGVRDTNFDKPLINAANGAIDQKPTVKTTIDNHEENIKVAAKENATVDIDSASDELKTKWERFSSDKYYNVTYDSDKMKGNIDKDFAEMSDIADQAKAGDEQALKVLTDFAGEFETDTLGSKFGTLSPTKNAGMAKFFLDGMGIDMYTAQFAKNYEINQANDKFATPQEKAAKAAKKNSGF